MLDKHHLGMGYSGIGNEFDVNEPKVCVCVSTEIHINKLIYWLIDKVIVTRVSQEVNPVFHPEAMVQYSLIHCSQWLYRI